MNTKSQVQLALEMADCLPVPEGQISKHWGGTDSDQVANELLKGPAVANIATALANVLLHIASKEQRAQKPPMQARVVSQRGHLLADVDGVVPVLTVELCSKWYGLQLLHPDKRCEFIHFPDEQDAPPGESAYRDHVPNPRAVMNYAGKHGIVLGEFALELIIGRWHLETTSEYE